MLKSFLSKATKLLQIRVTEEQYGITEVMTVAGQSMESSLDFTIGSKFAGVMSGTASAYQGTASWEPGASPNQLSLRIERRFSVGDQGEILLCEVFEVQTSSGRLAVQTSAIRVSESQIKLETEHDRGRLRRALDADRFCLTRDETFAGVRIFKGASPTSFAALEALDALPLPAEVGVRYEAVRFACLYDRKGGAAPPVGHKTPPTQHRGCGLTSLLEACCGACGAGCSAFANRRAAV